MLRQHYAARCRSSSSVTLQRTLRADLLDSVNYVRTFDSIAVSPVTVHTIALTAAFDRAQAKAQAIAMQQ